MPRPSMITHASQLRAKRKRERRSSRAIWWEIFPAARLTFDSFSNSMGARLRRWKSSHNNARSRWISALRPKTMRESVDRLAQLYEATGQSEKVAEWARKL